MDRRTSHLLFNSYFLLNMRTNYLQGSACSFHALYSSVFMLTHNFQLVKPINYDCTALRTLSTAQNTTVVNSSRAAKVNGNGHVTYTNGNGVADENSPMSGLSDEDDDDDVPLLVRLQARTLSARDSPLLTWFSFLSRLAACYFGDGRLFVLIAVANNLITVTILTREVRARNAQSAPQAQGYPAIF